MQRLFASILLLAAAAVTAPQALGHVTLTETDFEAGRNFAAFFKVDEGCGASATVSLEVRIPESVIVLEVPEKPGWTLSASRVALSPPLATERGVVKDRVTSVTWRGRLDEKTVDQFGLFVKLPAKSGRLYFPVIQRCESGETHWTDTPAANNGSRALVHPAPALNLIAVREPGAHASGHDHH